VSTKRQQARRNANQRATVKPEQKTRTYESAVAERNAESDAARDRTERLKALRLEHEARIQQHLRSVKSASKNHTESRAAARRRAEEPERKITLADWLAQQRTFGRET
jgi:hypothetical protein